MVRRCGFDAAEDLASEVFARAFDARTRFDVSYDTARPWLLGIARNVFLNEQRSRARTKSFPTDDAGIAGADPDHSDSVIDAQFAWPLLPPRSLRQPSTSFSLT